MRREPFKHILSITPESSVTSTAVVAIAVGGANCSIVCTSGSIYVSTLTTAVSSTNGYKVTDAHQPLDLFVDNSVYIASTATFKYQAIVHRD